MKKVIATGESHAIRDARNIATLFFPDLSTDTRIEWLRGGISHVSMDIPSFGHNEKTYLIKRLKTTTAEDAVLCAAATVHLYACGLPIPLIAKGGITSTSVEDFMVEYNGQYYLLEEKIGVEPGKESQCFVSTKDGTPEHWRSVGRILARIHQAGKTFQSHHRRSHYSVEMACDLVTKYVNDDKRLKWQGLTDDQIALVRQYHAKLTLDPEEVAAESSWLVHSDLNFGNIIFNPDGSVNVIFDMDNIRSKALRIEDIFTSANQTGRRGEGFFLPPDILHRVLSPLIIGYNTTAQKIGLQPLETSELKHLKDLFRLVFLYRLSLQRQPEGVAAHLEHLKKVDVICDSLERAFDGGTVPEFDDELVPKN